MNNTEVTNKIEILSFDMGYQLKCYREQNATGTNAQERLKKALALLDEIIELTQGMPANDSEVTSEIFPGTLNELNGL